MRKKELQFNLGHAFTTLVFNTRNVLPKRNFFQYK